jgi:hypothetical protein
VVKNSLSLSAVLVAVPAAVVVVVVVVVFVGVVVAGGGVTGGCSKFSTLLKAASKRVTPRLGAGDAVSELGTVLVLAGVAGAVVVWVTGVVVVLPDAAGLAAAAAAGAVPKDCARCSRRCTKPL